MPQKRLECLRLLFDHLPSEERPALFKSGQWHFHQDNTPVHNSTLVTDYLSKMGIKTVPHRPYSPDVAPCDFCLFPKLRGCRYETIEEMKEAVRKVIYTITQEVFHGGFQKLLERYNKCIPAGDYFEGDKSFMCEISIKVPIRKKSGNVFDIPRRLFSISVSPLFRQTPLLSSLPSSCYLSLFFFSLWN